ncbi:MAG: hypothetical protein KJ063_24840, partial [Anaerolineae bacterium]|nr:hypothetical protein [Anaerolineae bacterium]
LTAYHFHNEIGWLKLFEHRAVIITWLSYSQDWPTKSSHSHFDTEGFSNGRETPHGPRLRGDASEENPQTAVAPHPPGQSGAAGKSEQVTWKLRLP